MMVVDASAIQAAAAATSTTYRSFADATRSVLDLIERHLPDDESFSFLPKPFSLKELATAVKTTLEAKA